MELPPGVAFAHELEWTCKEPALVIWKEPGRPEISSLGLPCPTGKPTLLTLWVGKNANQEVYLMLHLRISIRVSKRRKILDHYLLPSSGCRVAEGSSTVHLKDASENVRQCLEEAYGKFSTQKCLRLPFLQTKSSRVLMPIVPDNAPCLGGTALHLLTLLHSLSHASSFEIFCTPWQILKVFLQTVPTSMCYNPTQGTEACSTIGDRLVSSSPRITQRLRICHSSRRMQGATTSKPTPPLLNIVYQEINLYVCSQNAHHRLILHHQRQQNCLRRLRRLVS